MRRLVALAAVATTLLVPGLLSTPAQAAPPGPQCVIDCDSPVDKVRHKVQDIVETCQRAYCQTP